MPSWAGQPTSPPPFGPLLDALAPLAGAASSMKDLDRAIGVVEALRATPTGERLSPLQSAPEQRASLVEAFVGLFEQLTESQPTALVIDDGHVAESATVATLARLVAVAGSSPLLLVVARRPEPTSADLRSFLDLSTAAGAERLSLLPLEPADLGELLRRLTGADPSADLLALAGRTGGNSFLAGEMVAALEATGDLVRHGSAVGISDEIASRVLTVAARDSSWPGSPRSTRRPRR